MSRGQEAAAIVIDNGSCNCRVGFSGDEQPRSTFPAVVGRPRYPLTLAGVKPKDNFIGNEAQKLRGMLSIKYPIQNGIVVNWDDMEHIWKHAFCNELRVNPENHAVFLSEAPRNPTSNRELMIQYMFEKFNVPAAYVGIPAVMALYAVGRITGIAYDSGEGVSHCLPIVDGYAMKFALQRMDFGGRDVTEYLATILTERGYSCLAPTIKETVREIKETLCLMSLDFHKNIATSAFTHSFEKTFELPDGQVLSAGNERFRAPEIMFQPDILGHEFPGVHSVIHQSVMRCNEHVRRALFSNIVLSGGNTMFHGFAERLDKEITGLIPPTKVRIIAPLERKISVWVGGTILSSLASFSKMCLTREEYHEFGPTAVHRKCL